MHTAPLTQERSEVFGVSLVWVELCTPTGHLSCGLVPTRPWSSSGPWPDWGPLFYSQAFSLGPRKKGMANFFINLTKKTCKDLSRQSLRINPDSKASKRQINEQTNKKYFYFRAQKYHGENRECKRRKQMKS